MVFSTIANSYFDEFPFRKKDKRKPSSGYFYLSHAHSDHVQGLKKSLTDPDAVIVCSRETASIINILFFWGWYCCINNFKLIILLIGFV